MAAVLCLGIESVESKGAKSFSAAKTFNKAAKMPKIKTARPATPEISKPKLTSPKLKAMTRTPELGRNAPRQRLSNRGLPKSSGSRPKTNARLLGHKRKGQVSTRSKSGQLAKKGLGSRPSAKNSRPNAKKVSRAWKRGRNMMRPKQKQSLTRRLGATRGLKHASRLRLPGLTQLRPTLAGRGINGLKSRAALKSNSLTQRSFRGKHRAGASTRALARRPFAQKVSLNKRKPTASQQKSAKPLRFQKNVKTRSPKLQDKQQTKRWQKKKLEKQPKKVQKETTKNAGRYDKQAQLRELANDPKLGRADRGWIKQEKNSIARGKRKSIRNPPGKDLAHERGREASKGYGYKYSNLQDRNLHRLQHKYDNFGRKNKERPPQ